MSGLSRYFYSLGLVLCLIACAGGSQIAGPTGGGAGGGPVGAGQVAGGPGEGTAGGSGVDGAVTIGLPPLAQASGGDGTLGSQSSNVDMVPGFYREHSLYFAGEALNIGAEFSYILPSNPGTLPDAQVLKIFKNPMYKEVPCLACEGHWVRAVNCGAYTDLDIVQMMPQGEKETNPVASNPLLWFLLHMPRAMGNSDVVTCEGATYRDFPVKNSGMVDLEELELHPHEIVVFYLLSANPPVEVGPLSTEGSPHIPKEAIAASAQQGLIRFVRPRPHVQIHQYLYQVNPLP